MANDYSSGESIEQIAEGLIPNHHPELATARMMYVFREKAGSKGGREQLGKAKKQSGFNLWALEKDFVIEVALDKWNELDKGQRVALLDHLLECCTGEEDEKTAEMKWSVREPEVQTFVNILSRHGAWHQSLEAMIEVAQNIQLDGVIEEEAEINIDDLVDQSTAAETAAD